MTIEAFEDVVRRAIEKFKGDKSSSFVTAEFVDPTGSVHINGIACIKVEPNRLVLRLLSEPESEGGF